MEKGLQIVAVNKVLAEMEQVEKELNVWNTGWWEERQNDDKLDGDFKQIDWKLSTKKSAIEISFHNNGEIDYQKMPKIISSKKNNKSCLAAYNVLHDDYKIIVKNGLFVYDYTMLSLEKGILIKIFNNTKSFLNLENGTKTIRVDRLAETKDDDYAYSLDINTNPDSSLDSFTLLIYNMKDSQINQAYQIKGKGNEMPTVTAYSGIVKDLASDSTLWLKINNILYTIKQNVPNSILRNFIDYIMAMLSNDIELATETYNQQTQLIEYFETNTVNDIKKIKNDIPVPGLIKKIDNSLKKSAKLEKKLNKKY